MKKILTALLILTTALSSFAVSRFDAKTWQTLRTYGVPALSKNFDSHVGELVEIHFNFRGKDIHHMKPGYYESSIWQADPESSKHFADVRVMIAQKDLRTFKAITTDASSTNEMTVYGRVLRDSGAHFVFVRLIGRNVALDSAGNATITW